MLAIIAACVHEGAMSELIRRIRQFWGIPPWWECHWGNFQGYPMQFWYNARTGVSQWEPPAPRWYYVFEDWDGNFQ